ncbi:MAG: DUF305 domain-containing protein [Vicinamibacterales bacterium]
MVAEMLQTVSESCLKLSTGTVHPLHGLSRMQQHHYAKLGIMTGLSFLAMYGLMYSMVDTFDSVYHSVNQVYMAALMAAPMVVIELLLMGRMYGNRRLNALLMAGAVAAGLACFVAIRQQAAITDRQFLRSMIPHHSGAILMCEEAPIRSRDIRDLCASIIESQRAEIILMKTLLDAR